MLILDVLLRYSTVTLLLAIALLAVRDGRGFKPAIYIVLATLSVAFMLLGTARPELRLPQPFHFIIRVLDVGNIVFIWWLGLAMFQDNFRLRWPHWLVLGINLAGLLPSRIMELQGVEYFHPVVNYGLDAVTFGIMGHLAFVTLKGRADDLVEPRRRLRLYFVMAMIGVTLIAVFIENMLTANHGNILTALRCALIFPLALWGLLWLTQMHPEKVFFKDVKAPIAKKPDIDPRDERLLEQLKSAMEVDHIYTEPGLTIRTLAETLKTPEHRLRALINQGLDYRNFSAFLNFYRIEAVKAAFKDPENSRIPVLTIAMDVGFNSLAPFNRAFRDRENMTPSAFRQKIQQNNN